ncbi:TonB-dependent siderophore receptor [Shewanella sp. WXL01]|uniref:TonB-dependent siderophore receptor n=1 Tax=Shewanella sp. WXL01 TaxID=2709721 RepID=UPI001438281D|nr:TonB-dependent siderophore receptor [Shewanella sp. WXL01]NKF51079.1 TonB-dependent siderophore receptor [Shewanella sp. WXL01]
MQNHGLFQKSAIAIAVSLASSVAIAQSADEATTTEPTLDTPTVEQSINLDTIERIEIHHKWQPYRGNVPLSKTPQAIDTISSETLENAGITRFQEALDMSSSVVRQNSSGGLWDSFAVRGFAGDENNAAGYLVNGYNVGRGYNGRRSTSNIEVIEVMKGPGSALYGQGEPGGTISIITKKPKFEEQGYVQLTLGDYDKKYTEFDYTNGISEDVAFRINGSYEDSDTYRDHVYFKSLNLHPSLLWNISDRTSVNYEMEILDQEKPLDRGVFVLDNNFDAASTNAFYGDIKDGAHNVKALGHQASLRHTLSDTWHLLTGFSYRESSFKGQSSDAELSAGRQLIYDDPTKLSRQRRERDYQARDFTTRLEVSGTSTLFGLENNFLIGGDYYDYHVDTKLNRWRTAYGSGDPTYAIDPNNPNYDQVQPETSVQTDQTEDQQAGGVYVQDQIMLGDRASILIGARYDKFKQEIYDFTRDRAQSQSKSALNPRLGITYEITDAVNLYTNYAEGFRPNPGLDSNGDAFDPEKSKSFEVGAKWQNASDTFSGNIAWFNSTKSNILTADPSNPDFSATLGEATSQGIELELTSYITDNTNVKLAYSYTDAKTANETTNPDWGVTIPKGSRLINIAEHVGNLSLNHYANIKSMEAYFGTTVNYVGDRLGETTDPDYILPAYTLVNLHASLQVNNDLSLKFDINNLFNTKYFESSYHKLWTMPGEPLNFQVSVKYQF